MTRIVLCLLLVLGLMAGCKEAPGSSGEEWISQEKALSIAKAHLPGSADTKWSAHLEKDFEDGVNGVAGKHTVWIVQAEAPSGNKETYFIEAATGKVLFMSESEAPHFGEGTSSKPETVSGTGTFTPFSIQIKEIPGGFRYAFDEHNTAVAQSFQHPDPEKPIIHLIRRVTDRGSEGRRFELQALSAYPKQKAFKLFPLADLVVKDDYSVDSVARGYGFLDSERLAVILPVEHPQTHELQYNLAALHIQTGEITKLVEGVPPDLSPDFLGASWLEGKGSKLYLNSFSGGKMWIADLKAKSVRALDGKYNHKWPIIRIYPSPNGERFWYESEDGELRLYDGTDSVIVKLPAEKGYRSTPSIDWSPDSRYGVMEFTVDESPEHVLYSENFTNFAPQGVRVMGRDGGKVWEKVTDPAAGLPYLEWSGWLADSGYGVLRNYKLERKEGKEPRKVGSVYSVVDPSNGKTTPLGLAARLEQLEKPEAVIGKATGQVIWVDPGKKLYWATGDEYMQGDKHAILLTETGSRYVAWVIGDSAHGQAEAFRYDSASGQTVSFRFPHNGSSLKAYDDRLFYDGSLNYYSFPSP